MPFLGGSSKLLFNIGPYSLSSSYVIFIFFKSSTVPFVFCDFSLLMKLEHLFFRVLLVLSVLFIVIFLNLFTHLFLVKQGLYLETIWIHINYFFFSGTHDDVVYLMPHHIWGCIILLDSPSDFKIDHCFILICPCKFGNVYTIFLVNPYILTHLSNEKSLYHQSC